MMLSHRARHASRRKPFLSLSLRSPRVSFRIIIAEMKNAQEGEREEDGAL